MKKIIIAIALLAGTGFMQQADAQIRVSLNIGTQPVWGPTGYDYARYYYLPELDVYYDVNSRLYYYQDRNRWVSVATLPSRFGRFDLYRTYKVVLNDDRPWLRADVNRRKYASFRNRHDQGVIRDSRDSRYWENAQHPHHNDWVRDHDRGNNNNNQGRPQRESQHSSNGRGPGGRR